MEIQRIKEKNSLHTFKDSTRWIQLESVNFPYVDAELDNGEGHTNTKVKAVKYPFIH